MGPEQNSLAERLHEHGYAIEPEVLAPDVADQLAAEIQQALRSDDESPRGEYAMRQLLQSVPGVRAVADSAPVQRLVESVLGAGRFVVRSIFFDKTEEANWKVPWHRRVVHLEFAAEQLPRPLRWAD